MKLPGRDLVAERLADLRDAERRLAARELRDVLEVDEDPLRGLGPKEDVRARLLDRSDARLEHEVELARLGQVAVGRLAGALARPLAARRAPSSWSARKRSLHVRQSTSGSVNPCDVARRLPHARVEDDRGVERDDVLPLADHRLEPARADVFLQEDAVVPVVVGGPEAAVDLRGREDEPAPPRERHDLLHRHHVCRHEEKRLNGSRATPLEPPSIRATRRSGETRQSQAREPENNVRTSYEPAESRTRMRAPPSGAFSAVTEPPCSSTTCRTIASPSPEPGTPRADGAR